ncbi:hypothetical protein RB599_008374 [Gaeumannomyces hyphopodioides]
MQSPSQPADRNGFHIAIICALPFESNAVDLLFDEFYDDASYGRVVGDTNSYTTGRVGNHAVVLLVLPNMGKETAAACSRSLQSSFPNINLALIVGVCGGLPSVPAKDVLPRVGDDTERDLFLGDVVISTSIVNYDFGRQYMGQFVVKSSLEDSLGRANSDIRGLLTLFQRERDFGLLHSKATRNLERLQSAAVERGRWATYHAPPEDTDNVFPEYYEHAHYNKECDACNANHFCEGVSDLSCNEAGCNLALSKPRRNRQQGRPLGLFPQIFMGRVASGNAVMKSGRHRDQVAKNNRVIAFEMEGAGAWDQVPCIVVKGVCDYADSHKNKEWQNFAAATAASVAVAILDRYEVPGSATGGAATSAGGGLPINDTQPVTYQTLIDQLYFEKIDERLTTLAAAHATTCRWFLTSSEYTSWHDSEHQQEHGGFLWIKGNPGTGKSTLMKLLFEEAKLGAKGDPFCITLSFFFLARGAIEERSTTGLYRSLLYQLLEKALDVRDCLEWLTDSGARVIHRAGWDDEALKTTLRRAVRSLREKAITIFVDALDECDQTQVNDMVCFFEELCEHVRETHVELRICFSSRHYPAVVIQQGIELVLEDRSEHTDDIELYIKSRLRVGKSKQAELLRAEILEKSAGIFLWVVLVLDIINAEYPKVSKSIAKIRNRLEEIPPKLHDLFRMILTRDGDNIQELHACLMWILLATRPLKPQELYFGVQFAVDTDCSGWWDQEDVALEEMKDFVRSASKGLANVTKTKSAEVQFIHESVRDFLRGDYCDQWSGFTSNLLGHGHQLLRDWCLRQLHITRQHVDIPDHTKTQTPDADVRKEILCQFPFLEYSTLNILSHANAAQQAGMDQSSFVDNFPLDQWRSHFNIVEQYKARRYTKDVSTLYILSERNLAALVRIHPLRHTGFDVGTQRYGPPIFAAVAMNGNDAVRELLKAQEERFPDSSPLQGLSQQYRPIQNGSIVRSFEFQHKRNQPVFPYLVQHGNDILLKVFLSTASGDLADVYGKTPLRWAAQNGHEAVVKLLFETGRVDVESKDEYGRTPLRWAAQNGYKAVVKLLLETGKVNVDSKDNNGETPLWWAARNGHEAIVKQLLATGRVDVDSKDNNGQTPLSWAAHNRHEIFVKLLLATGRVDVDSKDNKGQTPLSWAVRNGHEIVVKLLLATSKIDVDSKDNGGQTPLSWAARDGHEIVVKLLLATGKIDIDSKDNGGQTPLSWAARDGHEIVVKLLLATAKIDVDSKDNKGQTPLWWAARNGHEAVVKLLLTTSKIDVNSKDNGGQTPLSRAAQNGHEAVVKLLLATGKVDVNSKNDGYGLTPLSWAARNGYETVVKLLLATGKVNVDSKDIWGRTPLSWAVRNGQVAVFKLLLAIGKIDIDSKDNGGQTPLSWAAQNGHEVAVKLLLATGKVDVDSKDNKGQTPLSWAVQNGHEIAVKLLLATGKIDVDSKDIWGRTPLWWAVRNGHEIAVFKLLLATGKVDVDSKDNEGQTPLSWAAQNGHEVAVKLLLATGKVDVDSKDNGGQTPLSWAARNRHAAVAKLFE